MVTGLEERHPLRASKPSLCGAFLPGHSSRPHFHPNDRYILVLSALWWNGEKFDPKHQADAARKLRVHYGGKIHYDGAMNEECRPRLRRRPGTSSASAG
jgi:hypothetical protein